MLAGDTPCFRHADDLHGPCLRYEAAEARWRRRGDDTERVACCGLLGRKVPGLQYHADKVGSAEQALQLTAACMQWRFQHQWCWPTKRLQPCPAVACSCPAHLVHLFAGRWLPNARRLV
jgi:hypothetical protein